jgi:hypothetical protein
MVLAPLEVSVNSSIAPSGYFYPNRIARIYLQAMEEVMGRNGLNALLNLIGLQRYVEEYPPANLDKAFDFSDFSNVNQGVFDIYGPRGGRGLSLRGGRATFERGLKGFGALAGVGDLAFKVLPVSTKVKIGLPAMARVFSQFSDQISYVESYKDHYLYYIDRCPVCWGRESEHHYCFVATGLLQSGLKWVSGGHDFHVQEIECIASGGKSCVFKIDKQPVN